MCTAGFAVGVYTVTAFVSALLHFEYLDAEL